MTYTIYFNELDNVVEVVHLGSLTYGQLTRSIPAVQRMCLQNGCKRVLSDIRQTHYAVSEADEFALAQALNEVYPEGTELYILIHEHQIPVERTRLLENTARLHSIDLHFITDEQECQWREES